MGLTTNHTWEPVSVANLKAQIDGKWVVIPSGANRDPKVGEKYLKTGVVA